MADRQGAGCAREGGSLSGNLRGGDGENGWLGMFGLCPLFVFMALRRKSPWFFGNPGMPAAGDRFPEHE